MNTIKKRSDITPEILRAALIYNPETGSLTWKRGSAEFLNDCGPGGISGRILEWDTKYAGRPALYHVDINGYPCGTFRNFGFFAHRVIWALQTGRWPKHQIDHINGCRTDNRWENLREASPLQNGQNKTPYKNSSSKYLGVFWDKKSELWRAIIKHKKKVYHLGFFANEAEAALERDIAAWARGGEYAYLNFPDRKHDPRLAGQWDSFKKTIPDRRRRRLRSAPSQDCHA